MTINQWTKKLKKHHKSLTPAELTALATRVYNKRLARAVPQSGGMMVQAVNNQSLANQAEIEAREANRRIQRWVNARPTQIKAHCAYSTINAGRYSRRCTYIKYNYAPLYFSKLVAFCNGRNAVYSTAKKSYPLRLPSGYFWKKDTYGAIMVQRADGLEYHPLASDLTAKNFVGNLRKRFAESYLRRAATRKIERENERNKKIFAREMRSTRVFLQDSRRAGNCIAGTQDFLLRNFGIRDAIENPFFSLPAKLLMRTNNPRAMAAVQQAYARETLVSI